MSDPSPPRIAFDDGTRGVRWEDATLAGHPDLVVCALCGSCAGPLRLDRVSGELVHDGACPRYEEVG